jgi:lysozyme family protein
MAVSTFERALALVLQHEGGYVDHPADPGGATKYGITKATLETHRGRPMRKADVQALTVGEAGAIYRATYWDGIRGDALPAGLDYCLFDFAVNSGQARAVIGLQRALGVADDGRLGPLTLSASLKADPERLVRTICAGRMAFLRKLSTFRTFGKGWTRRVAGVEAEALRMARAAPARPPDRLAVVIPLASPAPAAPGGFFDGLKALLALLSRKGTHA